MTMTHDDTAGDPRPEDKGKLGKQLARYRLVDENCGTCKYRIDQGEEPALCRLVIGTVDPEHVCDLFDR